MQRCGRRAMRSPCQDLCLTVAPRAEWEGHSSDHIPACHQMSQGSLLARAMAPTRVTSGAAGGENLRPVPCRVAKAGPSRGAGRAGVRDPAGWAVPGRGRPNAQLTMTKAGVRQGTRLGATFQPVGGGKK